MSNSEPHSTDLLPAAGSPPSRLAPEMAAAGSSLSRLAPEMAAAGSWRSPLAPEVVAAGSPLSPLAPEVVAAGSPLSRLAPEMVAAGSPPSPLAPEVAAAGGQRSHVGLVVIHGAGKEPSGYYRDFADALSANLGVRLEIAPVWWSDLCNLGSAVKGSEALSKQARDFRQAYLRELGVTGRSRAKANVRSVGGTLLTLADLVNDVVQYFFNPRLRAAVQGRLVEKLSEACQRFDHSILVSHSLGSVIAYDVLRAHAAECNVHTWYTTGCPLAKLAKLGFAVTDVGEIGGGTLAAWDNLYDAGDVAASPLSTAFPFPIVDTRVENGAGILGSHNYWGNAAVAGLVSDSVRARYRRLVDRVPPVDAPADLNA